MELADKMNALWEKVVNNDDSHIEDVQSRIEQSKKAV